MRVCDISNCSQKHYARGLCRRHYYRKWKTGTTDATSIGRDRDIFKRLAESCDISRVSKLPEYTTWHAMLGRCLYPCSPSYSYYGGRGIRVCKRWHSFLNFYEDMGPRPTSKHRIDRIDSNGDYTAENCRWITHQENIRNRSTVKLSMDLARQIRMEYAEGDVTQQELAALHNIVQGNISRVLAGEIWAEASGGGA